MAVSKINGFHAPYRAETFRQIADAELQRNGILEIGGAITQVGQTITVPSFTVVQNGLIYSKSNSTTKTAPSMLPPYALVVSSSSPANTDNLIFSFVKSPSEITQEQVVLGSYDGDGWRVPELVSIDALIKERQTQNIISGAVGPCGGLKTSIVSTDYVTTPGDLIDKNGERQSFTVALTNPVVGGDADWQRVDRILFRRPKDSPLRDGTIKFVLGGAFAVTPTHIRDTNLIPSTDAVSTRIVIASDNTAHVLSTVGSAGSYVLKYAKMSSDRQTVLVSSTTIISGITDPAFDAVIDSDNVIHVVYTISGDIKYQKVSSSGSLVDSAFTVDSQSLSRNPRCKLDPNGTSLFIVYEATDGGYTQLFATSRDVASGGQALTVRKITEPVASTSNKTNPDLDIDNDFFIHIVWEDLAATVIEYQKFDIYLDPVDESPFTVSSGVRHGLGILVNGASSPRVHVSDDMVPFIAFRQNKSGSYGVSFWTPQDAFMTDFFAGENISAFDFYVDPVFNGLTLIISRAASVDYVKMIGEDVDFTVSLSNSAGSAVALVRDRLGAVLASWKNASTGVWTSKLPAESYSHAFTTQELPGDVLLARLIQPDGLVLNWIKHGRPGSFYDFLIAHGNSVLIDWEVTSPGHFTLGSGLKIMDMFTGTDFSVAAGSYAMLEGQAIYVLLDGASTAVTPLVDEIALVPWDAQAVVLGIIAEGRFNPAVMGVAGMIQMDSGETVIFGQDLPQTIRARIGIIDETHYQAYTSTLGINSSDTYPQAISNLDIMAGQNRHVRMVGLNADWSKSAENKLSINSPFYVQIPGLQLARNQINTASYTLTDGQLLYVNLNRTAGADAILTPTVATASSFTLTRNTFVIARREGVNLLVDSFGHMFKPGDVISDVYDQPIKEVRLINRTLSSLPSGASATVDGKTIAEGDRVLFAHSSLNKIYVAHGVGSSITWAASSEFDGATTPTIKAYVKVYDGSDVNKTIWSYDGSTGWYRVSSLADFIEVRASDLTTTVLPTGSSLVVDGETIAEGELVLFGNAALNRVYRVTGIGSSISFEVLNVFHGYEAPQDGSRVLAQDGSASDVMWEYDEELGAWTAITLTYQNKLYLGLTSPTKDGGAYQDQLVAGQLNNVVQEGDILEQAIKRLDIRQDTLKKVTAVDLMSTTLPTGDSYGVDGVVFADGDTCLFIRPALSGIYRISGVGTAISWTKLYEFNGNQDPSYKDTVFVSQGSKTNRTIWLYDPLYNPPWIKLIDPDFIAAFAAVIAQHTLEINQLQDQIAAILANRPNFETFTAGAGGQKIFDLTKFETNGDNTVLDVYVLWNGRWQDISAAGDFVNGQYRKNSTTQIEMAETIPEGETVTVYMWDPAALFTRVIKVQKFTADLGGQSIFTLNPLIFAVEEDNTIIDCEYLVDGRWQTQSILGDFSDGGVRKNTVIEIELSEPLPAGKQFVVIRRVPTGVAPAGSGGDGGSTDVSALTTPIGFVTPQSVGTVIRPAESLIVKDQVTSDVWKIEVVSGVMQVVKVN